MADGGGDPPAAKRRKNSVDIDVKSLHKKLKVHSEKLGFEIERIKKAKFVFFKVVQCNAIFPCSFTDAWCQIAELPGDSRKVFSSKFQNWFDISILEDFLYSGDMSKIRGEDEKKLKTLKSFEKLACYMDIFKETAELLEENQGSLTEAEWACLFGTHVIKKLSIATSMRFSDVGYVSKILSQCSCGCKEKMVFGDTSLGNVEVWHGSVDIMIGSSGVTMCPSLDIEGCMEPATLDVSSSVEMKINKLHNHNHQLCAQSIVLACAGGSPLIAVSHHEVQIYLYDFSSDILIKSEEFKIGRSGIVLALWMVLNDTVFRLFPDYGPSVSSGFKSMMKEKNKLKTYEEDINFFHCKRAERGYKEVKEMLHELQEDELSPK